MSLNVSSISKQSLIHSATQTSSTIAFLKNHAVTIGVGGGIIASVAMGLIFGPIASMSFLFGGIAGFVLRELSNWNSSPAINDSNSKALTADDERALKESDEVNRLAEESIRRAQESVREAQESLPSIQESTRRAQESTLRADEARSNFMSRLPIEIRR